jgi:diguanylate cyclase (GGDEF)-like protein
VPPIVGLAVAAPAALALVTPGIWILGRAAGRTGQPRRHAYLLLAIGASVALGGLMVTAVITGLLSAGRIGHLTTFVFGFPAAALLLLAGLIRLSGAVERPGGALRDILDGALLAVVGLHVVWTLGIQPAGRAHASGPVAEPWSLDFAVNALPVAVGALVIGIASVLVWRARPPRKSLFWSVAGLCLAAAAGAGLQIALRYGSGPFCLVTALGYALGLLGTTSAARYPRPEPVPDEIEGGDRGVLMALVPATLAIGAAMIRIGWLHTTDNVSIGIAAVVGLLLTVRQAMAVRDAHRYARRLAERESIFKNMAYTDALTGLGNRRQLTRVLGERNEDSPPCVLLAVDLDGFKNVNDVRGHDVGDEVLVEVARRLRQNLRPGDVAARLGGDEFAVFTWASLEEAQRVAERLLAVLGQAYQIGGCAVFLSASIGLAAGGTAGRPTGRHAEADLEPAVDMAALLHNADVALRSAKQRGKSRVERYDGSYDKWMRRRTTVEQELRGAVDREELSLMYQPVVAVADGRPVGVEALLRWHNRTLGTVPPHEFLPIAEEADLVTKLDRWVLHQACHQLSRWLSEGHDVWVSVNISVRELYLPEYVRDVIEVLRAHRIPPCRLVLEVTEHNVALDLDELVPRIEAVREVGVRVALDAFGAGLSSLSQLRRLRVDMIKIDRSVMAEPVPLVDVLVHLGQRMGLDVVAEGVDQPAHRELARAARCEYAQGELFSRPVPAEHVEAMLVGYDMPQLPTIRQVQDVGQVDSAHEMRQS